MIRREIIEIMVGIVKGYLSRRKTIEAMVGIIQDYLSHKINRCQAVERLIYNVNIGHIRDTLSDKYTQEDLLIIDCYYAIKHLTHPGDETIDDELQYLGDCLIGKRVYNVEEKNELIRNYYKSVKSTNVLR